MISTGSSKVRILFYNHTGQTSGAERVLLTTLHGLDREAFDPVAACPDNGNLRGLLEAEGVKTVSVGTLEARFTSSPTMLLRYLGSFGSTIRGFRNAVKEVAPDVLHANSVRAGIVASIATLGTGIPIVWHVHDDLPQHLISSFVRLAALLSPGATFLAVSEATATAFRGALPFGDRVQVLYNGIDLEHYPVKTTTASGFREELGLGEHDFLVCAVGMINPRKGLTGLLEAWKVVENSLPDGEPPAHLAIVGAPIFNRDDLYLVELQEQARRLGIEASVHFTGARSDIPAVLRSSDLLVLNALVEPFGLVLVEAMSSGTPVLATRVGGIPEIVTDNETGFLVAPSDPAALAARILEVIADPSLRWRVASAALKVCARFSQERYGIGFASFLTASSHSLDSPFTDSVSPGLTTTVVAPRPALPTGPISGPVFGPIIGAIAGTGRANLKVALFHDNFAQNGGAERVAEVLHRLLRAAYPDTDLLTTLTAEDILSPYLRRVGIRNTWMQHLPARGKFFRAYFLLYPLAIDGVDLSAYDLIVSSCIGYAKGVRRRPGALHICYCHTPMRWVWRTADYLSRESNGRLKALALTLPLRWLKTWELRAATRPDLYLANSAVVADRLLRAFNVHATVIPPPIDTTRFAPLPGATIAAPDDFYLCLSRLVPYKRFDLAVEACTRSGRRLIVIGGGPDRARLEQIAGPSVTFLGRASDEVVCDYARRCRALIFPGEEDFGMTPLEINAAGRPVVAFRGGGATETVIEGLNGTFFNDPTAESLMGALDVLESRSWDASAIRLHSLGYDVAVFERRILDYIDQALAPRTMSVAPASVLISA